MPSLQRFRSRSTTSAHSTISAHSTNLRSASEERRDRTRQALRTQGSEPTPAHLNPAELRERTTSPKPEFAPLPYSSRLNPAASPFVPGQSSTFLNSSGRDSTSSLLNPSRIGLPRVNRSQPGRYYFVNRATQPQAFRTPQEQVAANTAFALPQERNEERFAEERRVAALGPAPHARPPYQAYAEDETAESEAPLSEVDNDETGDYIGGTETGKHSGRPPLRRTAAAPAAAAPARAAAFDFPLDPVLFPEQGNLEHVGDSEYVDGEGDSDTESAVDAAAGYGEDVAALPTASGENKWVRNQPKTQPLKFEVPADANGGVALQQIAYAVDFTSRASVTKANKARALAIWRQKDRLGMANQLLRPSTVGREYRPEHDEFISIAFEGWALENGGRRLPIPVLGELFNQQFPGQNRTEGSLSSHIDRTADLKAMRDSYHAR